MQEYYNTDSFKLAYDIIKLDCRRDQIWEELLKKEGDRFGNFKVCPKL